MFPYFFFVLGKGRKQIHPAAAAAAAGRSFSSDTEKTGRFPISKRKHFSCAQLHPEKKKKKNRWIYHLISSIHTHARAHTHTVLASQMSLNLTAIFVQSLFSSSLSTQCAAVHTHTHRRTDERTREGGRRGEESKGDFLLFFFFARSPLMMTWSPTPQAAATANTDDDDDDVVVC